MELTAVGLETICCQLKPVTEIPFASYGVMQHALREANVKSGAGVDGRSDATKNRDTRARTRHERWITKAKIVIIKRFELVTSESRLAFDTRILIKHYTYLPGTQKNEGVRINQRWRQHICSEDDRGYALQTLLLIDSVDIKAIASLSTLDWMDNGYVRTPITKDTFSSS
ncbi:hypothetical protein EVAR_4321_1 [Eumeta japonica]|uniref:Uncharacterized protein n=1 Tax=Eumeta variegata TaxID=151549 RepID=A0A4C1VD21_EUMVA|nr:hypothetical protein EVAR_4321_1 [Eumeta japonica]